MNTDKPKKIVPLSFRVDEELAKRIEENALKANRSKSNFVTTLLTNALDEIDRHNNLMR